MKNGLNWLDSDMHMAEPWDLWRGYIEPEFEDKVYEWAASTASTSGSLLMIRAFRVLCLSYCDALLPVKSAGGPNEAPSPLAGEGWGEGFSSCIGNKPGN